jgi:hypothetical protein
VVRNFALTFPAEVAGIIFVDSAFEGQRVGIGGKATTHLGEGAKGVPIPPPHEEMAESDKPPFRATSTPDAPQSLDPLYRVLPLAEKTLQLWAQSRPELEDAEDSQREWSGEYFAKWFSHPTGGNTWRDSADCADSCRWRIPRWRVGCSRGTTGEGAQRGPGKASGAVNQWAAGLLALRAQHGAGGANDVNDRCSNAQTASAR